MEFALGACRSILGLRLRGDTAGMKDPVRCVAIIKLVVIFALIIGVLVLFALVLLGKLG